MTLQRLSRSLPYKITNRGFPLTTTIVLVSVRRHFDGFFLLTPSINISEPTDHGLLVPEYGLVLEYSLAAAFSSSEHYPHLSGICAATQYLNIKLLEATICITAGFSSNFALIRKTNDNIGRYGHCGDISDHFNNFEIMS
jgi:hypothetical protein